MLLFICKRKMTKLILYQHDLNKRIYTGWKIFVIGAFPVNYGGGIVFLPGIIKKRMKYMSAKRHQQTLKIGNRMKMFWIHGFLLHYGHFPQWAGRIQIAKTLNGIFRQMS